MTESLEKHRQAMHDAFFQDRDQELLDFLDEQATAASNQNHEALKHAAGIEDPRILDRLEKLGVTAATMHAFTLLPLVRLAWADAKLSENEFEVLLKAAEEEGIAYGTPAYRLLTQWINERPSDQMVEAWIDYAEALSRELNPDELSQLRRSTLERASKIARASGGFLGLGAKTSHEERIALHDLEHALTKK